MTPIEVFFVVGAPLALIAVLAVVLFSGRLGAGSLRRLELALIVIFYPLLAAVISWRVFETIQEQDWLGVFLMGGMAVAVGLQGYQLVRRRLRVGGTAT